MYYIPNKSLGSYPKPIFSLFYSLNLNILFKLFLPLLSTNMKLTKMWTFYGALVQVNLDNGIQNPYARIIFHEELLWLDLDAEWTLHTT